MMNGMGEWRNGCFLHGAVPWMALFILLTLPVSADQIFAQNKVIEGRVLEDSTRVLVVETVAGEYVVVDKHTVTSIDKEAPEEFYFRRANYHLARGEDNEALRDFLEVMQRNPQHEKPRQSIDAINHQRKKDKWDQELEAASQFIATRDYRKAISAYQRVLDQQPDEPVANMVVQRMSDTHARMAFVFYDHCYDRGAIVELARAEELNPENAEIYFVLAKIHESDRKYELARLEYERAIELDPQHQSARDNLLQLIDRTRGRVIQ